jgi:hypothetical protein
MLRDSFIRGCLNERFLQIAALSWHLEAEDQKSKVQKAVVDEMTKIVANTSRWTPFVWQLCWAIWYGRYANNLKWGPIKINGQTRLGVVGHEPVNGDKILYGYDGSPRIMINHSTGAELKARGIVKDEDIFHDQRSLVLSLKDPRWRQRFIIHKHECFDADFYEGEMAGGVHGVGLRSQIYWNFELRDEMLGWAINHLKKMGVGGILIFYYEDGNPQSQAAAEQACQDAGERYAIAMPMSRGGSKDPAKPELLRFEGGGINILINIVKEYFEQHIERLIIGQTLSSKAESTGLGSGVATFHEACVPVDGSEILTREGFKSAHEVNVGEDVLSYDLERDVCEWVPLVAKTFYEQRPVVKVHVDGQRPFEAICTMSHNWPVEQQRFLSNWENPPSDIDVATGPRGGMYFVSKPVLKSTAAIEPRDRLVLAAKEVETTESILTPTEAAVLGWAITDGHIRKENQKYGTAMRVAICQSKEENFEAIRSAVGSFGAREWAGKPFTRRFPQGYLSNCKPQHWWTLPGCAGRDLLKKCNYTGKHDLPRIVTRLSGVARKAMLEAMMAAEGSKGAIFYNKNKYVIEAFDILCALEGLATSKLCKRESEYGDGKPCFNKSIKKTRYTTGQKMKKDDAGVADVWCPTTKHGTWVMRQHGRVMITGNTKWRVLKFDANNLADTLTEDFIPVIQRWNCPKANFRVRFVFDVDDPKADAKLKSAQSVFQMGGAVKKDELLSAAGFAKPEEDDDILTQELLLKMTTKVQADGQIELLKAQTQIQMEAQQAQMQEQMAAQQQQMAAQQQMQVPTEGQQQEMPQDQEAQMQQAQEQQAAQEQAAQQQQAEQQAAQEQQGQQVEQIAEEAQRMTVDQILEEVMGSDNTDETEEGNYIRLADGTSVPLDPAPPENGEQGVGMSDDGFVVEYKATRAPVGGISISGKHYEGGQFIPGSVIARASPEEKAALAGQKAIAGEKVPEIPASRPEDHGKSQESAPQEQKQPSQTGMVQRGQEGQEQQGASVDDLLAMSGIRAPNPDEPILIGNEYELIQETERWLKTDFKLRPLVMNKIKEFGSLTPREYARARGRAYQKEREVTATGDDTLATMALRIIDQYSGNRSKAFDRKQSLRGVPKAVAQTSKHIGKLAERAVRDPNKLRRDIEKSPIAKGVFGKIGSALNVPPEKIVVNGKEVENPDGKVKRLVLRAAVQGAMDLAIHAMKQGINAIVPTVEKMIKKKGSSVTTSQSDEWLVGYQDEVPASAVMHQYLVGLFKEKMQEAMQEAGIDATEEELAGEAAEAADKYAPMLLGMSNIDGNKPVQETKSPEDLRTHVHNVARNVAGDALVHLLNKQASDSHSEGSVSLWIRDKIKNRIRRSGLQVSEIALEELANAEAATLAPAVARALESYAEKSAHVAPIISQDVDQPVIYIGDDGALIVEEHKKPTKDDPSEVHSVTVVGKKEPFWGQTWSLEEGGIEYPIPLLAKFAEEHGNLMSVPTDELSSLLDGSESDEHDRSPSFRKRSDGCDLSYPLLVWHKDGKTQIIDGRHRITKAKNHGVEELPVYVLDSLPGDEENASENGANKVEYAEKRLPGGHIDDIEGPKPLK